MMERSTFITTAAAPASQLLLNARPRPFQSFIYKRSLKCQALKEDTTSGTTASDHCWRATAASVAAAALILVQHQPALAESQFSSSSRRAQEFASVLKGKDSNLEAFFSKAPKDAQATAARTVDAIASNVPDVPISKPVETATSAAEAAGGKVKNVADNAKDAADSTKGAVKREAEVVGKGEEEPKTGGGLLSGLISMAPTGKLEAPQPAEVQEQLPEAAPSQANVLPEQPKPEPESNQLPSDSPGGKTQDTKSGGGFLNLFGGSSSGNSSQTAAENVEEAKKDISDSSSNITQVPGTMGSIAQAAKENTAEIAEAVESGPEQPKDSGTATLVGVGVVVLLAILIFTLQGNAADAAEGSKEH